MFIFKKFQKQNLDQSSSQNGTQSVPKVTGRGVYPMGQHLQRKFARGIQYNMKIIIRGDRNVGKTCLYHRLRGDKFHEEYVPSEEIQVASIHWNYNATDDIVKVEIWDVVDKGKKRENLSNTIGNQKDKLKMHNNNNALNNGDCNNQNELTNMPPSLDAEFVDVYKGTNGVIFLFDMTKAWTFEYIEREIRRCPSHIPILILANHRDMGHHRVISSDQVQGFIDSLLQEDIENGITRTGQIRHAEASMRNGFGLRYLYKFFNLPYLHLQRETLLKQLDRNLDEIQGTCQELDGMAESDEHNYDLFLETITNRRRMVADQLSSVPKTSTETIPTPPRSVSVPANMASAMNGTYNKSEDNPPLVKPTPSIIIGANNPIPSRFQKQFQNKVPTNNQSNGLSKFSPTKIVAAVNSSEYRKSNTPVKNIEDFVPDDNEHNMFRKFLDEPTLPPDDEQFPSSIVEEESDDDMSQLNINPMVAKYQEEIDPEDLIIDSDVAVTVGIISKVKLDNHEENFENNLEEKIKNEPQENQDNYTDFNNTVNITNDDVEVNIDETYACEQNNRHSLNCDDINALENLYISNSESTPIIDDHNLLNCHNNIASEASSECSSVTSGSTRKSNKTSTDNSRKRKKKISTKFDKPIDGDIGIPNGIDNVPKKKSSKSKLKTKNKTPTKDCKSDADILDEERRQLEEFLGNDDMIKSKRDFNAYEMF